MNKAKISYKFIVEKWIFPILIFLYPMINAGRGICLSDTGYSMSNYMFFDRMQGSWKYATYLANLLGSIMIKLCDGRMLYMNMLTSMIISATALLVYYGLRDVIKPAILFLAEIMAVALCWTPSVILYNYLTYFLLTAAVVSIYKAVTCNEKSLYYLAGFLLGLNFFVRISNAIEVLLIFPMLLGIKKYTPKRKKGEYFKPLFLSIAGYISGLIISVILCLIISGKDGIVGAFGWALNLLAGGNENASDYSMSGMILTILKNYGDNVKWLAIILMAIFLGVMGFMLLGERLIWIKRVGYTFCSLILFVYLQRNGVFNLYYRNTGAIWGLSVIFILCQYLLCIYTLLWSEARKKEVFLAAITLILLIITPLGSNNHLFTLINSMFFTMPVSVWLFMRLFKPWLSNKYLYPLYCMFAIFITVYFFQANLFHMDYLFKDGEDGADRDSIIEAECVYQGMETVSNNAAMINELLEFREKYYSEAKDCILFGDTPGVSYLYNLPPALSTSWPDLDSYSIDDMKKELSEISLDDTVIIVTNTAGDTDKLNLLYEAAAYKDNICRGKYFTALY